MVRSAGFEPTTPGLGILCSILLSYERNVMHSNTVFRLSEDQDHTQLRTTK